MDMLHNAAGQGMPRSDGTHVLDSLAELLLQLTDRVPGPQFQPEQDDVAEREASTTGGAT